MNSAFSRKRKGNIKFMSNVNGNGQQYIKKRIYGHVDPLSMENMYIRVVRSESSLDPEKGRPRIMRTTASYNKLWKYLSKAVSAFRICLVVNCLSRQFLSNCFPPIYLFQTASMWEREREKKEIMNIFVSSILNHRQALTCTTCLLPVPFAVRLAISYAVSICKLVIGITCVGS